MMAVKVFKNSLAQKSLKTIFIRKFDILIVAGIKIYTIKILAYTLIVLFILYFI